MLKEEQLPDVLHQKKLDRTEVLLLILAVKIDQPKRPIEIKRLARDSGCPEVIKWNISNILSRTKGLAINLKDGWRLTSHGRHAVEQLGVIPKSTSPKKINHADQLKAKIAKIKDSDTQDFLKEAIQAYEIGLYRSAVVLSWAGAISLLYDFIFQNKLSDFNSEATRRNPKWRAAVIKDDLGRIKESDFLDIIGSPPISLIGKNIKEELKNNCLQLRNTCGHPNSFQIGEQKVAAHIEVLILNIFSKFA